MTILRGAGFPAAAVVIVTAVGFAFAGTREATSVLIGGAMALVALAVAPIVQRLTRRLDPAIVLGIAVLSYSLVMFAIGFTYSLINDFPWMRMTPAGMGVIATILGWSVGHIWTAQRLRQFVYDAD